MRSNYLKYFLFTYTKAVIRKFLKLLFGNVFIDWNVITGSFDDELNLINTNVIKNNSNSYFADPFIIDINDKIYIFVEEFFWQSNIGKISLIELNNFKIKYHGIILEEDFHLSFPFVFNQNNLTYMIPESHQNTNVSLYVSEGNPLEWKLKGDIIKNVCTSDTVILPYKKSLLALTNNESGRFGDRLTNLSIYKSNTMSWQQLPQFEFINTISTEATRSRNGGLFKWKDNYYRVNQLPAFNIYGKSINVNKICLGDDNNELNYHEESTDEFKKLFSGISEKYIGCHHLHINEKHRLFVCDISTLKFNSQIMHKFDIRFPKVFSRLKKFLININ
ncbi:hypothetical protein N8Y37_02720 [Amylibacter sp.]|nr:hypothetical protein [Amylibacter sp.]MDC1532068.1 hypothetical protein [Amylibacter sp.]